MAMYQRVKISKYNEICSVTLLSLKSIGMIFSGKITINTVRFKIIAYFTFLDYVYKKIGLNSEPVRS